MKRLISPGRLAFLGLALAAILTLYLTTLYKLQIVQGNEYYEQSTNSIVTEETVIAARGNLMDRYGRLLVSNRNCNNLLINTADLFPFGNDTEANNAYANSAILRMCTIVTENGDTYTDELPITRTTPFEYVENMTALQQTRLDAWLKANGLDSDATAVEVMARIRSRYGIDNNYTAEEMRTIAGIRYEINIRYVVNTSDYVFAEDVSIDTITALMEADVPGIEVQVSYIREYNTAYAAHILGYTGLMNEEEYEIYKEQGYKLNASVGKSGAELAFEDYLHGSDGTAEVTRTSEGVVTGTVYKEAPEPGNHVYLTIDIELQAVAEQALASYIIEENATRERDNAIKEANFQETMPMVSGGALVIVDVHTGEPLCMANYPTFSLNTFLDDFQALLEAPGNPLYDRALMGLYSPGSTFKPVTAVAALSKGFIGAETPFICTGVYDEYKEQGYTPHCTGVHGSLVVTQAITYSCNLFFYQVGNLIGQRNIESYATQLGLGQPTGIELNESIGRVASPEWKETLYRGLDQEWYAGDTLQMAIGQSDTAVTPLQLARYCAALANYGTVYECSILKSISSYDYSDSIFERTPTVRNEVDSNVAVWELIRTGMIGAANSPGGTVYSALRGHTPTIAAKTGTTETGSTTADAIFICYAPAEDPEIAVAVVAEKGARGSALAPVARQVIDYYFSFQQSTQQTETELTLLR